MTLGAPPKLNYDVSVHICEDIRAGCYQSVAAARAGIIPYTLYMWNEHGKREMQAREARRAQGKPADEPMSIYELFYLNLEAAKADARHSAETRVFRTQPLAWLRSGYARKDWAGENTLDDALQARVKDLFDNEVRERVTRARQEQLQKLTGGSE
jgi:hypothetical protein